MNREILLEVVPMLSKNSVSKKDLTKSKNTPGVRLAGKLSGVAQQASFRDLCGQGGVQIGNTKVFFRQVSVLGVYSCSYDRLSGCFLWHVV